jgi:hypothetical protein
VNTFGTTIPFAKETTEFFVTFWQSHENGRYLQITTNLPLICPAPHAAENFLHIFIFFLFMVGVGNRD